MTGPSGERQRDNLLHFAFQNDFIGLGFDGDIADGVLGLLNLPLKKGGSGLRRYENISVDDLRCSHEAEWGRLAAGHHIGREVA